MNPLTRLAVAGALGVLSAAASAAPANQDFESGLAGWTPLGNVSATGPTSVAAYGGPIPVSPYGNLMARLVSNDGQDHGASSGNYNPPSNVSALESFFGVTLPASWQAFNGSGIKQEFSGIAGEVIQQRWNFVSTDAPDSSLSNDTAFAVISGPGISSPRVVWLMDSATLAARQPASVNSGWQLLVLDPLPQGGLYTIGFGVVNGGDNYYYDAELFLDDFRGVPEPGSLALLGLALAGLGSSLRRGKAARR